MTLSERRTARALAALSEASSHLFVLGAWSPSADDAKAVLGRLAGVVMTARAVARMAGVPDDEIDRALRGEVTRGS